MCYIDIPGHQTPEGGTLPHNITVSTLRPDNVLIDEVKKNILLLELTVPGELRIEESNRLKGEKYQHFTSDIKTHTVSVLPFEIGSHTGYVTQRNNATLRTLHKYCKKDIKLKQFIKNISSIVVLGSYYIFNCRNVPDWEGSGFILSHFPNQ